MGENDASDSNNHLSEIYARAGHVDAELASKKGFDSALVEEAKMLSEKLIEHIKRSVGDYDDFVRRAERSEIFALHDSAQFKKDERALKVYYMRAIDLADAVQEANEQNRR